MRKGRKQRPLRYCAACNKAFRSEYSWQRFDSSCCRIRANVRAWRARQRAKQVPPTPITEKPQEPTAAQP